MKRRNQDCIAIYSRKSRFTGKGESVGNQVELCREYICAHYGAHAPEAVFVYEDEGFSGGNLNRPDFRRMMEDARAHRFCAVVVYRLDRISRNISDFAGLIGELSQLGIDFVSIREQFDTGSPMGRAMMYIASVFSQLERETIAERIRDNMHELAKTGRWLGGTTPVGYGSERVESVTVDGRTKKSCMLRLIPEEAQVVRMIYELYLENGSLTATEAELMKRGVKTRKGCCHTRFSIRSILQNPVYLQADPEAYDYFVRMDAELFSGRESFDGERGMMVYNRTDQEKGRATVWRPVCEWIVAVGRHPGLIPGREWVRVQESLERGRSKSYHSPRGNEALLTGLLYCGCGGRMYPKLDRRRTVDGRAVYTYVCKRKERSRGSVCQGQNAQGNLLDAAVLRQVGALEEDRDTFQKLLRADRGFGAGSSVGGKDRAEALRREMAETERKAEALVDTLAVLGNSTARENVVKRIEELNQKCRITEARIRELERRNAQASADEQELPAAARRLSSLEYCLEEMTTEQKRAAVRALIDRVVWDGGEAHVYWAGAEEWLPDVSADV